MEAYAIPDKVPFVILLKLMFIYFLPIKSMFSFRNPDVILQLQKLILRQGFDPIS